MTGHSTWQTAREKILRAAQQGEAARVAAGGEHVYLSTGCLHGEHDYCKADAIASSAGTRRKAPAQCKFCQAPCICECHGEGSE